LVYSNNKLIIAGAANIDKNPALSSPAIILTMQLNSGGSLTSDIKTSDLESYVTTDVAANTNSYFAVSGDNGSLFKFDSASNLVGKIAIEDLRTVAVNNDKVVTLSGTKGVNIYNASTLALSNTITVAAEPKNGSKRTIDFLGNTLLVSEGDKGFGVYNMTSGAKIQTFAITPNANISLEDAVTNAVSVNGDYVFVANGGNGLNVYKSGEQLTILGSVGIEGSANYVKTSGDYIYVASGKGGLKIIKMEKPAAPTSTACTGLPAYNLGNDLVLRSNETKGFYGSTGLNSIVINSNSVLTHCGSISVQNNLVINSNSKFIMNGSLSQGKYQQANPTTLSVDSNATLQIEGSAVIWGDLTLKSNSNVKFSNGSSITVYGKVNKSGNVSITGNYTGTKL
jgi:hypothetical protein